MKIMKTPAELFSLKGKVAVVIGGTGVLCGEMAEGLAIAGATVALVGRDATKAQAVAHVPYSVTRIVYPTVVD